ncbi:MAG: serine/threonine-protein kinase [Gordonia sp. (in: high G+C Gram-positive bacteria)]|uniref:serine/threonine-protein kinase n=1 Tax=Gordonia sp. (in: high G+C Gram-positive bacteria) TaxID=84139 RepID=UPI003BB6C074
MAVTDRSGTTLGPYRLVRRVGRGGMGEVYEAVDTRKDRTVALKVLPENLADDVDFRARFLRESQTVARLNDPHVIPIHDFGEIDGQLFLDMRIVHGRDLRAAITSGTLTPERAVDVVTQIAGALDTAHAAGLTHRDVKPENILLDGNGFAYLVDFGLVQSAGQAGLTSTGMAIGSFNYMAPERFGNGTPIGPPADIYALGCVLFESLTGTKPFGATSMEQIIAGHLARQLPPTGTVYDGVIARATAKDPAQRYRTAGELAAAATAAPHQLRQTAVAPTPVPPTPPVSLTPPTPPTPAGSNIGLIATLSAAVVLVAAIGGLLIWNSTNSTADPDSAAAPAAVTTATTTTTTTTATTTAATTTAARPPGDLGLATPISTPPCDGRTVAFVYNATNPGTYAQEVDAALARFPGSSYLRTDQSCQSLRQSLDGNPIYAVYYPGTSLADTCATRNRIGGETYARRLDNTTPVGVEIC